MILSKCAACDNKKSRFVKKQEENDLLSKLEIKTSWSKIALLVGILL